MKTFNTNRACLYAICIFRLSKISEKAYRDTTYRKYEKCRNDCIVFKGTNCINDMLDYLVQFEGEAKRVDDKFFMKNLYLIVHNGSGFDS